MIRHKSIEMRPYSYQDTSSERGVSRWLLPSPFGEGLGVRLHLAVTLCDIGWLNVSVECCVFCSSVFSVRKNMSFFICHYVILSYKNHQFLSLTLLFCLQKNICLSLSLCHSVFKKTSVPLCHSVILSSRPPLLSLLSSCYSVFKITLSTFVIRSLCRPSEDTELR